MPEPVNRSAAVREILSQIGLEASPDEVNAELRKKGIKAVDPTIVYSQRKQLRDKSPSQPVETRAQFQKPTDANALREFFKEHGSMTYGEAEPLLKQKGINISNSYFATIRKQVLGAGADSSSLIDMVALAKQLVEKLGKDEAIKLIKILG